MKQFMMLFVIAVAMVGGTPAQEKREDVQNDTPIYSWQGYLVDARSAPEIVKDPDAAMKNAAEYTKESGLKGDNQSRGFGIVAEGKWLKFDSSGDKQAVVLLKNTKREKGILITITGKLNGDIIAVSSIKEYLPDNSPK